MIYMPKKAVTLNGHDMVMSPPDLEYADRILSLTGEITDEMAAILNSSLRCLARSSDDDIILYIQSPGGSVDAGMSIHDTIKALHCDVVTCASGRASSMAAFLLAAAGTKGKRYVQPNAQVMIHQPLGSMQGQASDVRIHAANLLAVRDRLTRLLAQSTGQSIQQIEIDTDRDNIMNAEAAVAYGLVDLIGDPISDY